LPAGSGTVVWQSGRGGLVQSGIVWVPGCLCEALGLGRHYWLGVRRSMAVPAPSVSEAGRIASPLYVIACA